MTGQTMTVQLTASRTERFRQLGVVAGRLAHDDRLAGLPGIGAMVERLGDLMEAEALVSVRCEGTAPTSILSPIGADWCEGTVVHLDLAPQGADWLSDFLALLAKGLVADILATAAKEFATPDSTPDAAPESAPRWGHPEGIL